MQLSYTIGLAHPLSLHIETFGTGIIDDDKIADLVSKSFDFRLAGIIWKFELPLLPSRGKGCFYQKLAAYGHMGRSDIVLPWEETDMAPALRELKI